MVSLVYYYVLHEFMHRYRNQMGFYHTQQDKAKKIKLFSSIKIQRIEAQLKNY